MNSKFWLKRLFRNARVYSLLICFFWGSCKNQPDSSKLANPDESIEKNEICEGGIPRSAPKRIRLLSNIEYRNTVGDIFGKKAYKNVNLSDDVSKHKLFDNITSEHPVSKSRLKEFLLASEVIAKNIDPNLLTECPTSDSSDQTKAVKCIHRFLKSKGQLIYRKVLSSKETKELTDQFISHSKLKSNAFQFEFGVRGLIQTMLTSHKFLYKNELGVKQSDGRYKLTPFEVASALSYFFWRSGPDHSLLALAKAGRLQTTPDIKSQVKKMLDDPRSKASTEAFISFLTRSYNVLSQSKQKDKFPEFDESLKKQLDQETKDFFNHLFYQLPENTDFFEKLYLADYTIGGESLAKHYNGNLDGKFIRLPKEERVGILGHSSILSSYAYSDYSSPIHRGVFVVENLLCRPFPAPPATDIPDPEPGETSRERFKKHAKAPCKICHKAIDGAGFSLENYDAIGKYYVNDKENGKVIDVTGQVLIDGEEEKYKGPVELATLLAEGLDSKSCFINQWHRFAHGYGANTKAETCAVNYLFKQWENGKPSGKALITEIFSTEYFLFRHDQKKKNTTMGGIN